MSVKADMALQMAEAVPAIVTVQDNSRGDESA